MSIVYLITHININFTTKIVYLCQMHFIMLHPHKMWSWADMDKTWNTYMYPLPELLASSIKYPVVSTDVREAFDGTYKNFPTCIFSWHWRHLASLMLLPSSGQAHWESERCIKQQSYADLALNTTWILLTGAHTSF